MLGLQKKRIYLGRGLGMWAYWLHRLTGLALVAYLLLHIMVISSATGGAQSFDPLLATLQSPLFVLLDLGLLALVLIHGLNGIRIFLFDLGIGIASQKQLFTGLMAVAVVIFLIGTAISWPHMFK